jgi:hypothetical protein
MTLPLIWSPSQGSGSWWHVCGMFVDNAIASGHQVKTMALNYFLEAQEQKIERNKSKSKRQ